MRIRQVVWVARDLEPLVERLCALFGTGVAFNDPGVKEFGLRNAVLPVGDQFLEVVTPIDDGATAKRYLERRKGDGGYMLILQTDDLDRDEKRLGSLGVRIVWKGDLPDIRGRHLHPKDTGGTLLSLDEAKPPESWRWAGPRWKEVTQAGIVRRILAVEIQSDDPERLARRWAEVLDRPVDGAVPGGPAIRLDDGAIRFVADGDGRGEGLSAIEVEATDPARVVEIARQRGLAPENAVVLVGGVRVHLAGR